MTEKGKEVVSGEDETGTRKGIRYRVDRGCQEVVAEREICIVVAGEDQTGKSSLIAAAKEGRFDEKVPRIMPETVLPSDLTIYNVPITLVDTKGMQSGHTKTMLKKADAIILTYSCNSPTTFLKLREKWFPYLIELKVNHVPVIVVGCKIDLPRDLDDSVWKEFSYECKWLMDDFRNIETCLECSSKVVPSHAKLKCSLDARALDESDMLYLTNVIQDKLPKDIIGVNQNGYITLEGFIALIKIYIEQQKVDVIWTLVKVFGYDDEITFKRLDLLHSYFVRYPDQSVELTEDAKKFLTGFWYRFNVTKVDVLTAFNVDQLFSLELDRQFGYKDEIALTESGGLSLDVFLTMWELMAVGDPAKTYASMIDLGYVDSPTSALHINRKRQLDWMERHSERNVFQCYVFGAKKAGKSSLLDYFLERKSSQSYTSTIVQRFAAGIVQAAILEKSRRIT